MPRRLILFASEFPPGPGGIGTHAYELARHLEARGWEVVVLATQDYASDVDVDAFNAAQTFRMIRLNGGRAAAGKGMHRWRVGDDWMRQWKPDAVIASGMRAVWLAAALCRRHRIPWVAVGHGTEFGVRAGWQRALNRRAYEAADMVVCVSRFTLREMEAAGIRARETRVIYNGADPDRFALVPDEEVRELRERLDLNGDRLIVTVGNVTERKGQDVIIRAMPHVLKHVPDARYMIAGLPTCEPEFSELARSLGVEDRVRFLGKVQQDDLVRLLNAAELFAMTSRYTEDGDFEGYGIAVIEAALCGKPAVVSNNSGLVEAIVDGYTGFAVPQDDPTATASAITSLLRDDLRRRAMGETARERAETEQTWRVQVERYADLLDEIVSPDVATTSPSAEGLHVLHVIDTLALGGAERMLVELANQTARDGHRVTVCLTRQKGPLAALLDPEIPVHVLDRRRRFELAAVPRFVRLVRRGKVSVIHAHGLSTFSLVAFLRNLNLIRVPVIAHDHYGKEEGSAPAPFWFRHQAARSAARYVGVGPRMAGWARGNGISQRRIQIIENALDPQRILDARPTDIRHEREIDPGVPLGLVVGNLRAEKGVATLIDALARSRHGRRSRMLLAGGDADGEYARMCRRRVAELGLDGCVDFLGERRDVPRLLQSVDFAVVPSHSEGGQLVLMEAVAAGLPFVATRVGEVAARFEALELEEFVPPLDAEALAAALDRLLELSPEERRARGEAGRETALPAMRIDAVMPRWYGLYREVEVEA